MRKILSFFWILFIASMLALFFAPNFIVGSGYADKMLHIVTMCVFMLGPVFYIRRWPQIFGIALLTLTGVALLEWAQGFIPGRSTEIADLLANGTGILCGLFIGYLLRSGYEAEITFETNPNTRNSGKSS